MGRMKELFMEQQEREDADWMQEELRKPWHEKEEQLKIQSPKPQQDEQSTEQQPNTDHDKGESKDRERNAGNV